MNVLPGIGAPMGDATPYFTFVGAATSTGSSLNFSGTGLRDGDVAIYFDYARQLNVPAVTPSGFTQGHSTVLGSYTRGIISAKILDGTEGSVTGMNGSNMNRKIGLVFRPSQPLAGFAFNGQRNAMADGDPSISDVLSGAASSFPIIVYGQMAASSATITSRTISPTMVEVAGAATNHYAHYLIYDANAADQSYDTVDSGGDANTLQAGYLTFTF